MLLTIKSKNAPSEFQKVISPHLVDQKHPAIAFSKKLLQPLLGIIKLWAIRSGDAWNYLMQKSSHFLDFLTWDLHTCTAFFGGAILQAFNLEKQKDMVAMPKNLKVKPIFLSKFKRLLIPNSDSINFICQTFIKPWWIIFGYKFAECICLRNWYLIW